MKIKKRHLKKIIILAVCLLLCCIVIFIYRLCEKKNDEVKITKLWASVYTDVNYEDMKFLLSNAESSEYFFRLPIKKEITEDIAPFYRFMVCLHIDTYAYASSSTFSVTDYGEFADNWFYRCNANGGGSNCYELGLYQGDLTEEEVKRAVYSIKTVYSYTDKNGKYHDIPIEFDSDTTINYEKFAGLNQQ